MKLFRNRKKKELVVSKSTLTPDIEFTLEEDGFIASLFKPENNKFIDKAVIVLGGTEGRYDLTKLLAEQFTKNGMTTLALAYFNEPGLPDHFEKNPIDYVEKATQWLKNNGFSKIGIWGISKGAELALISASLMPDLITSVTAVCPINVIPQGFVKKDGLKLLDSSSWSWRGEELPWAPLKLSKLKILLDSLESRSVCLRSSYLDSILESDERAQIPVENINGPILLITPEHDDMWPSEIAAKKIVKRLESKGFKYPVHREKYKYASHILVPLKLSMARAFSVERRHSEECWKSKQDSFDKTLAFWKEAW